MVVRAEAVGWRLAKDAELRDEMLGNYGVVEERQNKCDSSRE